MKRLFCIFLVLVMLSLMILPAAATEVTIQPRWTYLDTVSAALDINWLGVASCSGQGFVRSSNKIEVVVILQQYSNTGWVTLKSWSSTGTTSALASGQYAVAHGYTYRVNVFAYVYDSDGNIIESGSSSQSRVF